MSGDMAQHSQGFGLSGEPITLLLRRAVVAEHEADAEDEDVRRLEGDTLLLRAREDVLERDRVRRERVVGQLAVQLRVVLDHVEEHAATANTVLRPVCANPVSER